MADFINDMSCPVNGNDKSDMIEQESMLGFF